MKTAAEPIAASPATPAALFRALSDDTRLRAVLLLASEGELCVCELTFALVVSQPKMSRHLAVLREVELVADRRDGVWIHYRLAEALPTWARAAIEAIRDGCVEDKPFRSDFARLRRMPGRPGRRCG